MRKRTGLHVTLVLLDVLTCFATAGAHGGPETPAGDFALIASPVALVLVILTTIVLVVRVVRWRAFAARFPLRGAWPQNTIASLTRNRLMGVGNLSIGTSDEGLVVGPSFAPLRALLPAVAVPWEHVVAQGRVRRLYAFSGYRLERAHLAVFEGNEQDRLIRSALDRRRDRLASEDSLVPP